MSATSNNKNNNNNNNNIIRLTTDVFTDEMNDWGRDTLMNHFYSYSNTHNKYSLGYKSYSDRCKNYTASIRQNKLYFGDNIKYAVKDSYVHYFMANVVRDIMNIDKVLKKKFYYKIGLFIGDKVYHLYFKQYDVPYVSEVFFKTLSDKLKELFKDSKYCDYDFMPCHYVDCKTKHIKYYIDWVRNEIMHKSHDVMKVPFFPKRKINKNKIVMDKLK
jgi:hypothetical protein